MNSEFDAPNATVSLVFRFSLQTLERRQTQAELITFCFSTEYNDSIYFHILVEMLQSRGIALVITTDRTMEQLSHLRIVCPLFSSFI